MTRIVFLIAAMTLAACTPETRTVSTDKSQFDVMRSGVNMDERALACANDPQSVGFSTSQACFADAQKMMTDS